jgi:hypothetical protein
VGDDDRVKAEGERLTALESDYASLRQALDELKARILIQRGRLEVARELKAEATDGAE